MLKCCVFIAFGFAPFVSVDCACSDYTAGVNSGLICISQTEFVFEVDIDRTGAAPFVVAPSSFKMQCPAGTVCADVPGACAHSAAEDPICSNGPGLCGSCGGAKLACVTQTEFTFCSGDEPVGSRQKCPTGKYCQVMDISVFQAPCAGTKSSSTCKATATMKSAIFNATTNATQTATRAKTPTAAFSCAGRLGSFAATTDTTCRQYYYCYSENNAIQVRSYWCSATTVYNPTTKKCVASSLYKCTNV